MENLYECQGFGQDTPCIHAPLDASSLLVPCLLLVQLENWHVLQDGWLRSISKSWAEGWKEAPIWELSSTHWVCEFVNQISPIHEWIQTSFVNLIHRKDLMQSIHFVYILDVTTVLMNAWSRAGTDIKLCSNCGVFLHKAIKWLQRTLIYCTDYSIFTFITLTRITWLFFRNFTLCVQLGQVWNITSASNRPYVLC